MARRRDVRRFGPGPYVLGFLRDELRWGTGFPFDVPAVAAVQTVRFGAPVTLLAGDNGSGKSTLIEAVAVAAGMNAEGGGRNFRLSLRATESALAEHLKLERSPAWPPRTDWFLRAESFFNLATELDELGPEVLEAYGGRSLHAQSHGESFLALAVHRFGPRGLYVLDEPEAALSPQGQLAFLQRLSELVEEGCQLLIATHSPLLLAFPGARIYELGEDGIQQVSYEQADLVSLYRSFLRDPERYLRLLG
jgi:predicted ATPase